jgi:hypothetical protein
LKIGYGDEEKKQVSKIGEAGLRTRLDIRRVAKGDFKATTSED